MSRPTDDPQAPRRGKRGERGKRVAETSHEGAAATIITLAAAPLRAASLNVLGRDRGRAVDKTAQFTDRV